MPIGEATSEVKKSTRLRRRVWIGSLCALAAAIVLGGAGLYWVARPERIRLQVQAALQQLFRGSVAVQAAELTWFGDVRLVGVQVFEAAGAGTDSLADPASSQASAAGDLSSRGSAGRTVFSCPVVELRPDWLKLIGGTTVVTSVTAVAPRCVIARDADTGRTNLADLLRISRSREWRTSSAPRVELRSASVEVIERRAEGLRTVEQLDLTIRGKPADNNPYAYDVAWRRDGGDEASGHARIDLDQLRIHNVRGGLPWMSLEGVLIALNARYAEAGSLGDLLGLEGAIRARDFTIELLPARAADSRATLELSNASLSIPVSRTDQPLPRRDRYVRFEQVYGTVDFAADGLQASFRGRFHGSPCQASATLRGTLGEAASLDDVDLTATVVVEGIALPRRDAEAPIGERRFVERWAQLGRFYDRFDPRGIVDVEVEVSKPRGDDEPLKVSRWAVVARSAEAVPAAFPYRVTDITGMIEATSAGVTLRDLRGVHEGGVITLNGGLDRASRCSAGELTITGRRAPIDAELCDAIPARFQCLCDRFSPVGTLDADIRLSRAECIDGVPAAWEIRGEVRPLEIAMRYSGFPYPVEHLSGTLQLDPHGIQLEGMVGRSGEGTIRLEGNAAFDEQRALSVLALEIAAEDIAIDAALLNALPQETAKSLAPWRPHGHVDIWTTITQRARGDAVRQESLVRLKGAAVTIPDSDIQLHELNGTLRIDDAQLLLEGVTGEWLETPFEARGQLGRPWGRSAFELTLRANDVRLTREVRAALPAGWRTGLAGWQIDGGVGVDVALRRAADGAVDWAGAVQLHGASVQHDGMPRAVENVRGTVHVDSKGARAEDLDAVVGDSELSFSFIWSNDGPEQRGRLTLSARNLEVEPWIRALPSERGRAEWEQLGLTGRADVALNRFDFSAVAGQPWQWSFEGQAGIRELGFLGAPTVRRMAGEVTARGSSGADATGPALHGEISTARMEVLGHRIDDVSGVWSYRRTVDGERRLLLEGMRGRCYEGRVTADLGLESRGTRTRYALALVLHQLNLDQVRAPSRAVGADESESASHGQIDLRLNLSGTLGDVRTREGEGRVEIHDARLYRMPLILAILNVLRLSMPPEQAFNHVAAGFLVMGQRVDLHDVVLRGPTLALEGEGWLSLPDLGISLNMVSVAARSWARVPGLTDFVERATREIVELQITGPLFGPTVRARALPGVTDEFKRLFQRKKPRKTDDSS